MRDRMTDEEIEREIAKRLIATAKALEWYLAAIDRLLAYTRAEWPAR